MQQNDEIKLGTCNKDYGTIFPQLYDVVPLYFQGTKLILPEQKIEEENDLAQEAPSAAKLLESKESLQKAKRLRKVQGTTTAGPMWSNMPRQEITPEIQRDLRLIQLRNVLDPKRFYKKDSSILSSKAKSGFFQVGTILNGKGVDTVATKQKKSKNIVDALLEDEKSRQYYKKKFVATQEKGVKKGANGRYASMKKKQRNK